MTEFQLQDRGRGVTSGVLAKVLGVTPQSVANYRNEGMPSVGRDGKKYLYDPDACEAWYAANKGGKSHGGDRENSGRKPRAPQTARPDPGRVDRTAADSPLLDNPRVRAAEARQRIRDRAGEDRLLEVEGLLHLTHPELLALLALAPEESGLTKTSLEHLKLIQDARAKHRAELEKLGLLVDAEAFAGEFGRELAGVREKLEQLPMRLLRAVMSAGDVAPDREHAVLVALHAEVDAVVSRVCELHGRSGQRPAERAA